jgi:hypothetical protein
VGENELFQEFFTDPKNDPEYYEIREDHHLDYQAYLEETQEYEPGPEIECILCGEFGIQAYDEDGHPTDYCTECEEDWEVDDGPQISDSIPSNAQASE